MTCYSTRGKCIIMSIHIHSLVDIPLLKNMTSYVACTSDRIIESKTDCWDIGVMWPRRSVGSTLGSNKPSIAFSQTQHPDLILTDTDKTLYAELGTNRECSRSCSRTCNIRRETFIECCNRIR